MTFDDQQVKDEAKDLGDLSSYKPTLFRNAALQQSKVELTWEETDVHRKELMKRAFDEDEDVLNSMHFGDIIAPGSSDEEQDGNEMNAETNLPEFDSNGVADDEEQEKNTKKKKGKKPKRKIKKIEKDDDFSVNVQDPRFAALYTSHLYNIDPSDPAYKKSKQMDSLVQEKLKRIPNSFNEGGVVDEKLSKTNNFSHENNFETSKLKNDVSSAADLSLLIKSVKSKTDVWQRTKKIKK